MKKFLLLIAFVLLVTTACSSVTENSDSSETEVANVTLDEMAAQKFDEYHPSAGSAVAFMDEAGFWYAVYPKVSIDSYEKATEEYPENTIPAEIKDFSFISYYPYDDGFSSTESYAFSSISNQDVESLDGKSEGIISLPRSCGQTMYAVHYQNTKGKVLVLSVDKEKILADDNTLTTQEADGKTFYMKNSQPYTLGIQVENGPAIWLYSIFPESGVPYTENDPKAELSQDELKTLLVEVSRTFSSI